MIRNADPELYRFRPAWWLRNPHAQTIWGRFLRRIPRIHTRLERITAPDGELLELHHLDAAASSAPHVFLLHGLEGSPRSHYVGGLLDQARQRGWAATLLVFRGCGETPNLARRFYHSGETTDLDFALSTVVRRHHGPLLLAGVSLGGNVLLKWLGERGGSARELVRAAAAVSVPFDLEAGAKRITEGFSRVYDRSFLKSLRRKAQIKLERYPDLFDATRLARVQSIFDFDDAVTAPVHGFTSARDYYARASSLQFLAKIETPTLLLSARDDPFLPAQVLERVERSVRDNPALTIEFQPRGGHVGFIGGNRPWHPFYYAEWRVFQFFDGVVESRFERSYDSR